MIDAASLPDLSKCLCVFRVAASDQYTGVHKEPQLSIFSGPVSDLRNSDLADFFRTLDTTAGRNLTF